jgi:Xaa-Pro aminopeptidase
MPVPDNTGARAERLAQLRAAMARHQVDAFIVPSADPHLSEYLPGRWKGREWLSGFTGSVGTFIATADFAGVWTDGRYYTQAEQELAGSEIGADEDPVGRQPAAHRLAGRRRMQAGQTVAVDARVLGLAVARLLGDALAARGISCAPTSTCSTRSGRASGPAADAMYEHEAPYATPRAPTSCRHPQRDGEAGRRAPLHLDAGRHRLPVQPARRRRQLQPGVPGPRAGRAEQRHAVRRRRQDRRRPARAPAGRTACASRRTTRPPSALAALPPESSLLIDPRRVTAGMRAAVPDRCAWSRRSTRPPSPSRASSRRGAPRARHHGAGRRRPVRILRLARTALADPQRAPLTEVTIDEHITAARARRPASSARASAPSPASMPTARSCITAPRRKPHAVIEGDGLLLIDSGGQYLGGTTDITRVVPVGTPAPPTSATSRWC